MSQEVEAGPSWLFEALSSHLASLFKTTFSLIKAKTHTHTHTHTHKVSPPPSPPLPAATPIYTLIFLHSVLYTYLHVLCFDIFRCLLSCLTSYLSITRRLRMVCVYTRCCLDFSLVLYMTVLCDLYVVVVSSLRLLCGPVLSFDPSLLVLVWRGMGRTVCRGKSVAGYEWTIRPIISDACIAMRNKAAECVQCAPRESEVQSFAICAIVT